ncbi:MAG: hypothetical protein NT002_04965 [candidate division Zixibacteria bacterium]|nr:hypothetical protein [candidate division Zixibacteria bacterium]
MIDDQTLYEEDNTEENPIHLECMYRPEKSIKRLAWIFLGIILGAIIGFLISEYRGRLEFEKSKRHKTKYLMESVIKEIDENAEQRTDSPIIKIEGDTIPVMAYLKYTALEAFLNYIPELTLEDTDIINTSTLLRATIYTCNQIIDIRNAQYNEILIAKTPASLQNLVRGRKAEVAKTNEVIAKIVANAINQGSFLRIKLQSAIRRL